MTETGVTFGAQSQGKEYALDLKLKKKIDAKKSTYAVKGRELQFLLVKAEDDQGWSGDAHAHTAAGRRKKPHGTESFFACDCSLFALFAACQVERPAGGQERLQGTMQDRLGPLVSSRHSDWLVLVAFAMPRALLLTFVRLLLFACLFVCALSRRDEDDVGEEKDAGDFGAGGMGGMPGMGMGGMGMGGMVSAASLSARAAHRSARAVRAY